MSRSFEDSHHAYERGQGALAKELSNKGKEHQKNMEELNRKASEWIFTGKSCTPRPGRPPFDLF